MGNNNDRTNNRDLEVPLFEISEKGRVDLSIYKMTTGFLVVDQTSNGSHSVTSVKDIQKMMDLTNISVMDQLIKALNAKKDREFVDITIVIETKQEMHETPQLEFDSPPEFDMSQFAEVINDIMGNRGQVVPGLRVGGSYGNRPITQADVERYMLGKGLIKVKTRLRPDNPDAARGGTPSDNLRGKPYYDNKNQGGNKPQDQNKDKGQGGPPKEHKID